MTDNVYPKVENINNSIYVPYNYPPQTAYLSSYQQQYLYPQVYIPQTQQSPPSYNPELVPQSFPKTVISPPKSSSQPLLPIYKPETKVAETTTSNDDPLESLRILKLIVSGFCFVGTLGLTVFLGMRVWNQV